MMDKHVSSIKLFIRRNYLKIIAVLLTLVFYLHIWPNWNNKPYILITLAVYLPILIILWRKDISLQKKLNSSIND